MTTVKDLVEQAEKEGVALSDVVLQRESESTGTRKEELLEHMYRNLSVMRDSCREGEDPNLRSESGLSGGQSAKMMERARSGENLCGPFFGKALARALAVSECNACMGRIVASPTAGSCGILPAAVLTTMEEKNLPEEAAVKALFTAAGIGMAIAEGASISGAQGGCQAEVGAASAMAAAAITEMMGGTPDMCAHACAMALKNVLGLVCDPVAGLVEVPCIKRNAMGVANALAAAEMALCGIESRIPADEVIWAMRRVGDSMPGSLRETADGGLAATPTGRRLAEEILGGKKAEKTQETP